jgi:hypothetical protein
VWRVLILSSLLLAAQGACGGAPIGCPVAGWSGGIEDPPPEDPRLLEIAELNRDLRHLQRTCHDNPPSYADDVCDIREETCRIADDVRDNAWAAEKCATARRACRDAHAGCPQLTARPQTF